MTKLPPKTANEFGRLVEIVTALRAPDGCPWDREQTHQSLRAHLIEETCEVLDAIERDNKADMREELGDLLLQPVMHAQLAAEAGEFDVNDVLHEINEKLIRRHPHVFGNTQANNTEEVLTNWDAIKRQEKNVPQNASRLDGIAPTLSALTLAEKVSKKAVKAGFEWPTESELLDKVQEELDELRQGLARGDQQNISDEIGDLLFTTVNLARWHKVKPELALRDMVQRFTTRFQHMEKAAREIDRELESLSPQEWDELWNQAKRQRAE